VRQDANWNITSLAADGYGVSSPVFSTVERYEYDPYGRVTYLSGSFGALERSGFGQRYLHQGGRLDEVTGLYSFRFREYNPVQGRWKQADPAGYVDGGSLYGYVSSRPLSLLDPLGLAPNPNSVPGSIVIMIGGESFTLAEVTKLGLLSLGVFSAITAMQQSGGNPWAGLGNALKREVDMLAAALIDKGKCPTPCELICEVLRVTKQALSVINRNISDQGGAIQGSPNPSLKGQILAMLQLLNKQKSRLEGLVEEATDRAVALACGCV